MVQNREDESFRPPGYQPGVDPAWDPLLGSYPSEDWERIEP